MPLLEYHQSYINYEFRDHPKGNHGTLVLLHGFLERFTHVEGTYPKPGTYRVGPHD